MTIFKTLHPFARRCVCIAVVVSQSYSLGWAETHAVPAAATLHTASGDVVQSSPFRFVDVSLNSEGCLEGRVARSDGSPVAQREVRLLSYSDSGMRVVGTTVTDADGRFVTGTIASGVYLIQAGPNAYGAFRVWNAAAAPPAAGHVAQIFEQSQVVRGQAVGAISLAAVGAGVGVTGVVVGMMMMGSKS